MSEPDRRPSGATGPERWVEASDRPLLALAVAAMVLELVDLRGPSSDWLTRAVGVLTLAIDAVFAADLALKVVALGPSYTRSPWFLVDLLSGLPLLDTLANHLLPLRAFRFFRGFRILRVFRGLRVLRALRTVPAFDRMTRQAPPPEGSRRARRLMNLAMFLLIGAMLFTVVVVRQSLEKDFTRRIDDALGRGVSVSHLRDLGGSLVRPEAPATLARRAIVDGAPRDVFFDLRWVDRRVDQFEFFLSLGMMFSMAVFMYVMSYQQMDAAHTHLRGLLALALPSQVADRLLTDPVAYTRKSRMPATVLFMDFVGFTRACEELAHDPDRLSAHLEAALDRVVGELARHDMIIDKFIGDAVMSFRGGPLVPGTPNEHARRAVRAALDSTAALAGLNDPYFHRIKVGGASDDDCLIGAFGTSARLSYTVLGDGVNVAARLEPACAQCATGNLFDEATFRLCAGDGAFAWRRWGLVRVAGRSAPVQVYEAFDARRTPDTAFLASFHIALDSFERHDFERARDAFLLADSQRGGGDEPSRRYALRCEDLVLRGLPVGWEPVFDTHK